MRKTVFVTVGVLLCFTVGCLTLSGDRRDEFENLVDLVDRHADAVVLTASGSGAQAGVSPLLQGMVFASTTGHDGAYCCGWLNRKMITGKAGDVIDGGGEDRFWLGPYGGQFSLFFKKGTAFNRANQVIPATLAHNSFNVVSKAKNRIELSRDMSLKNYTGSEFRLRVNRVVRILDQPELSVLPGIELKPSIKVVAFESRNTLLNIGTSPWRRETGLPAIKIDGFFKASPHVTVVVPFMKGDDKTLGPIINPVFPGNPPAARLKIKDGVIFFRADGREQCGFGLSPRRSKSVFGSYDAQNHLLTIIQFNKPIAELEYVNSAPVLQNEPYRGNAITVYNGGPEAEGVAGSGYYRVETSSPAARLGVGGTLTHVHRTLHFYGSEDDLNPIAKKMLGVSISEILLAW